MSSKQPVIVILIVKNEEHVIERCLKSVLPYVDGYLIVDTGSTDATQQTIRQTAEQLGMNGYIFERPWINFGHNRTEALQLVKEIFGNEVWAFMIDADDSFEGQSKEQLRSDIDILDSHSGIDIYIHKDNIRYKRTCIFNMKYEWRYEGVVHEYSNCVSEGFTIGSLMEKGYYVEARCEGARSKDPLKYAKDAEMLSEEIAVNPESTRATFYCAQSLRDSNDILKAVEMYKKRAVMGGWNQEKYVSVLNIIRLSSDLSFIWKVADIRRLEVAAEAMRICRLRSDFNYEIYSFAVQLSDIYKVPIDGLFIEPEYYKWIFWDEFSIYSYYTGHYKESYISALRAEHGCPEGHKERIRRNVDFALDKL